MVMQTYPFDTTDAFDTPEAQADLLADAFASENTETITAALGIIARAQGMSAISRSTGISREAIYKATGPESNPTLSTLLSILKSAGIMLSATRRLRNNT